MGLISSSLPDCCCNPLGMIDNTLEKMIYFPPKVNPTIYRSILNTSRSTLIDLTSNSGHTISTIHIKPTHNNLPTKCILFSHGNGSDIYHMFQYLTQLSDRLDVAVIAYDYVGYGLSEQITPSEKLCYESLETVMEYLLNLKIDSSNIYLVGQSLGTGVVIDYLSKNNWKNPCILISPYKSICRVVANTSFVTPFDKFESNKKIKRISCPIKIFHGDSDGLINISHGIELYNNLLNKSLEPVWFEKIGHNDILECMTNEHYLDALEYKF